MSIAPQILADVMGLPAEERGELAYLLLESLPEDQRPLGFDADYETEVLRRIEEIDSGNAKLLTLEDVMARLRSGLSSRTP